MKNTSQVSTEKLLRPISMNFTNKGNLDLLEKE